MQGESFRSARWNNRPEGDVLTRAVFGSDGTAVVKVSPAIKLHMQMRQTKIANYCVQYEKNM